MQTIGVLGGIGPQATIDFEARIHAWSQRLISPAGNSGYPPMVVIYLRHPPVLVNDDGSPVLPIRPDPRLFEAARALGGLSDFLVITANGPHLFHEAIEHAAARPLLSMVEVTLAAVRDLGWQSAGLLGLGDPRIYSEPLRKWGVRCEVLDIEQRDALDRAIHRLMCGQAGANEQAIAADAVARLRDRQVDGIVLGCTEIPLLLGDTGNLSDLLNPADLLAEAAVRRAMTPAGVCQVGRSD